MYEGGRCLLFAESFRRLESSLLCAKEIAVAESFAEVVSCWELGTANQSDRLGDHVIRGRNDLSAKSTCT